MKSKYEELFNRLTDYVGGKDNIEHVTHCATRLRLVLKDKEHLQISEIEKLEKVKGAFVAGDQLQIIFGAGLVNEVCAAYLDYLKIDNNREWKSESKTKQNPFQAFIKSLSDVFIEIMPCILAAALLMGLTSLLSTQGLFGDLSIVERFPSIAGINRIISISSSAIFGFLPMIIAYSSTKRFGGRAALGLAIGAIMVSTSLADAFSVASGTAESEMVNVLGLNVELVGFQGGIIAALMIGFVVANVDKYFNRILPDIIKFVLSPMLTILIASFLLFTIVGPLGRELGNAVTNGLLWSAENLGIFGYMLFAGIQQLIVISGLHHTFGAIEGQLLVDTGRNFLNPLMSVALVGQGGAVLGYMLLHRKNAKAREVCVSAFTSVLFGISEPALFGVTVRYKYPLIAGCIAGAISGAYVYLTGLTAVGFGATGIPGFTIVDPSNNGHLHYIVAHVIAIVVGIVLTFAIGKYQESKQ